MEFTECIQPACDGEFNSFWLFSTAVPRFWILQVYILSKFPFVVNQEMIIRFP